MKPATSARLTLAAALTSLPLTSNALVNLGEGQINLNVSTTLEYDSQIRARSSDQGDAFLSVRTGLTYERPTRQFGFSASLGVQARRYFDYSEFDDESVYLDLSITPSEQIQKSRFTISGSLILDSSTRTDDQLGEIITTQTYGASVGVLYDPNRHYNLNFNASVSREDPDSDRLFERDTASAGLTLLVPINEVSFGELGGSWQTTDSDRTINTQGDTYTAFIGASGLLLPKLNGFLRVGAQQQETRVFGTDTTPYASAGLTWAVGDLTSVNFSLSHSVGNTFDDRSSETTSANLSASRQLNRRLSGSVGVGYDKDDLQAAGPGSRTDEEYSLFANLGYELNPSMRLSFDVRYSDQTSDDPGFEFDRWRTGVTVSGTW